MCASFGTSWQMVARRCMTFPLAPLWLTCVAAEAGGHGPDGAHRPCGYRGACAARAGRERVGGPDGQCPWRLEWGAGRRPVRRGGRLGGYAHRPT